MVEPTVDKLIAGHQVGSIARREDDIETAETLEDLLSKVQAMFREDRRCIAADLEAQVMADGVAFRPGPRERIDSEIQRKLRDAILAGVMISGDHRACDAGKLSRNTRLGFIGMLFGDGRQCLLAWGEYHDDLRVFALAGFERIDLENDVFERPEGFDLHDRLPESFGIWREEPQDVVWRFLPEVAVEAAS